MARVMKRLQTPEPDTDPIVVAAQACRRHAVDRSGTCRVAPTSCPARALSDPDKEEHALASQRA